MSRGETHRAVGKSLRAKNNITLLAQNTNFKLSKKLAHIVAKLINERGCTTNKGH